MAKLITFHEWYAQYDDAGNFVSTLDDSIIIRMHKGGLRTQEEWDNYYLSTEMNAEED